MWIIIRQTFWEDISFHFLTTIDQHESKQPLLNKYFWRRILTVICKERDPYSYCHTKHHFNIFVKVAPCLAMLIWKSLLTFGTEVLFELLACMHWESIGSFKDKSYLIGYVPELNWNWRALNRASFFSIVLNHMWNWNVSEVVIAAPKFGSVRFRGRNLYIFQCLTVKLKLEMWGIGLTVFLECAWKDKN